MSQTIGKLLDKDSKGNPIDPSEYRMEISIPFHPINQFVVKPVSKKSDKTPDYAVYSSGINVGGLWLKDSSSGKKYLTGSIFSLPNPIKITVWLETKSVSLSASKNSSSSSIDSSVGVVEEAEEEPIF